MGGGFKFDVLDMKKNRNVVLKCPEEIYELIALIGTTPRYTVARVWRARDALVCATTSTTKLSFDSWKIRGKRRPSGNCKSPKWLASCRRNLGTFHAQLPC